MSHRVKPLFLFLMFLLSVCLFTPSVHSKPWARVFRSSGDNLYSSSVREVPDGGYVVAANEAYRMVILKLSGKGNIEWQNSFARSDNEYSRASDIAIAADGGYVITGSSTIVLLVLKLDSAGNIQFGKTYGRPGDSSSSGESIVQTADGGYLVSGGFYMDPSRNLNPDIWLVKLDSSGTIQWQKAYGGPSFDGGHGRVHIYETTDGNFVIATGYGVPITQTSALFRPWIIKVNSSGSVIWQKLLQIRGDSGCSYYASSIAETSQGHLLVGIAATNCPPTSGVVKLTKSGKVKWAYNYGDGGSVSAINPTSDGNFVIDGFVGGRQSFIKIDSSGEVKSATALPRQTGYVTSIVETKKSEHVILSYLSDVNTHIQLVKLNSKGQLNPRCHKELSVDVRLEKFQAKTPSLTVTDTNVTVVDSFTNGASDFEITSKKLRGCKN